jgi:hypothetical protein
MPNGLLQWAARSRGAPQLLDRLGGSMAEDGARPRRRDAVYVAALALVIVSGLVYFGRGLEPAPSAGGEPGAEATARLQSSATSQTAAPSESPATPAPTPTDTPSATTVPPTPEATPTTPAAPTGNPGTCWDGTAVASLAECGLPRGAAGLEWVFPSFDRDREGCAPAEEAPTDYAVTLSYACFDRAAGVPVTITYDVVEDPAEVEAWMERRVGRAAVIDVDGPHGGRGMIRDLDQEPARISAMYARFPYVVSVFAPTRASALRAWQTLVEQRPPGAVRGVRA